jgi:hypothetical protein
MSLMPGKSVLPQMPVLQRRALAPASRSLTR